MDTTFVLYIAINIVLFIFGGTFLFLSQKGRSEIDLCIAEIIILIHLVFNCVCFYIWGKNNHLFDLTWEDFMTIKNELLNLDKEQLLIFKEAILKIVELF